MKKAAIRPQPPKKPRRASKTKPENILTITAKDGPSFTYKQGNINDLVDWMGNWNLEPPFQRDWGAWPEVMQKKLIRNIIRGRPMGSITIVKGRLRHEKANTVDGQHRSRTIERWVNNEFSVVMDLGDGPRSYYYQHIEDEDEDTPDYAGRKRVMELLDHYQIYVTQHDYMPLEKQAELFHDLNSGIPVSPAEKLFGSHIYVKTLFHAFYKELDASLGTYLSSGLADNIKGAGLKFAYRSAIIAFGPMLNGGITYNFNHDTRVLRPLMAALNTDLKSKGLQLSKSAVMQIQNFPDKTLAINYNAFAVAVGCLDLIYAALVNKGKPLPETRAAIDILAILCDKVKSGKTTEVHVMNNLQGYCDWVNDCQNSLLAPSYKEHGTTASVIKRRVLHVKALFESRFP